jgi:UDP-glucose 4-epimerase
MKALVTGGAGFIGSHIAEQLLRQGHSVIILDNLSTGKLSNIPEGAELIQGDISDKSVWKNLPACDKVFHFAAMVSVEESMHLPLKCVEYNINSIHYLCEYASKSKVNKILFASSAAIYGDGDGIQCESQIPSPKSYYGHSKLAGEHILRIHAEQSQIPFTAFRMFNVFGPRQSMSSSYASVIPIFIGSILNHKPLTIHGDGGQTRDFIAVSQIADYFLQAAENNFCGVCNAGNNKSHTILELANMLNNIAKENALEPAELINSAERIGDIRHSLADIDQLKSTFEFQNLDFYGALAETFKFYIKHQA